MTIHVPELQMTDFSAKLSPHGYHRSELILTKLGLGPRIIWWSRRQTSRHTDKDHCCQKVVAPQNVLTNDGLGGPAFREYDSDETNRHNDHD